MYLTVTPSTTKFQSIPDSGNYVNLRLPTPVETLSSSGWSYKARNHSLPGFQLCVQGRSQEGLPEEGPEEGVLGLLRGEHGRRLLLAFERMELA